MPSVELAGRTLPTVWSHDLNGVPFDHWAAAVHNIPLESGNHVLLAGPRLPDHWLRDHSMYAVTLMRGDFPFDPGGVYSHSDSTEWLQTAEEALDMILELSKMPTPLGAHHGE